MPSSYSFKVNDPPSEPSSSSYRPSGGGASKKTPKRNDLDRHQDSSVNNLDSPADPKNNRTNGKKTQNGVDPDAKWKSNYVPTAYENEKYKSGPSSGGVVTSSNVSSNSSNGAGRRSGSVAPKFDDALDAKWRSNYVATPYDLEKVDIQEDLRHNLPHDTRPKPPPLRDQWAHKTESVLACLGLSVGIGNIVRFPYLAYEYGGGSFLLPYLVFLVLVGMPLYYLELGIGQYAQLGPMNIWRCSSAMQGIGMAMVALSLMAAVYYTQIMSYCLHYLFASLAYIGEPLPWSTCGHIWTTSHCYEIVKEDTLTVEILGNTTILAVTPRPPPELRQSSALQYFRNKVLHQPVFGEPSESIGTIRWDLTLCLMLSWLVVFFVIIRGVKSTGKAAYVITTLPCILLFIFMINGLLMDGADYGLLYLFIPRWDELADPTVWRKALEQVLFSLSVTYGGVIMFGSHNRFRNKVQFDAVGICIADFLISIVSSVTVFSVLGAMAYHLELDDLAKLPDMGHSLAFVVYPSAISGSLPSPHLWAILFFLILFTLGLCSLVGHMHTILGAFQDTMPRLRSYTLPLAGVLCSACFLLGLPLCSENRGFYLLGLLSRYGLGLSVLVVATCELLSLSWLYGVRRISEDFGFMLGSAPSMFWKVCWAFVSPVIILVVLIYSAVLWHDPEVDPNTDPEWAFGLRLGLALVSVGFIPLVFLLMFLRRLVTKKLGRLFVPALSWGPGDREAREQLVSARAAGISTKMGVDNPALNIN